MAKKINTEILTVMFVDIVSYTQTTTNLDRESFNKLHDIFDSISLPIFKEHSGKVIKKIGDAFLVTFKSATCAVLCGKKLQEDFFKYNKEKKLKNPLQIRVAIHAGEVLHRNGDIYGDTVNTTSRIESITKAGDVVFSESVYNAMNKNEFSYLHLGLKNFKGLNIRVNAISPGGIADNQPNKFLNAYNKNCSTKGMLDTDDLSGTLIYLLSDMSKYVNGQNIIVDDGFTL